MNKKSSVQQQELDPILVRDVQNLSAMRAGEKASTSRTTKIEGTGSSPFLRKGQKRVVSKFLADQLVEKGAAKIL